MTPFVLVKNGDEWTMEIGPTITGQETKNFLTRLCFGLIVLYFILITRPAKAMQQPTEGGSNQTNTAVMLQVPREFPIGEAWRVQVYRQRNQHLISAWRQKDKWRDHPYWTEQEILYKDSYPYSTSDADIKADVIERGMDYSHDWQQSQHLNIWNYDTSFNMKLVTYRLTALVRFRETTVLPNVVSLQHRSLVENQPSISLMGLRINDQSDLAISTAMEAVADEIIFHRRVLWDKIKTTPPYGEYRRNLRHTLFEKTRHFHIETERLISESFYRYPYR